MKNILVIFKEKRDLRSPLKKELINEFKNINFTFAWKNTLSKNQFKEQDLIISIGGDGTFLSASHFIENQLILGVNSDTKKSEGALTIIPIEKLKEKLFKILQGKFKIKQYTREKVEITQKCLCTKTEYALNETFIGNINPHHPSNYLIHHKNTGEFQRSSGILVSTGTGSTAWYKALGGRKFSRTKKQLRFRIRELFTGRLFKPKIKKGKIKMNQKITILSKMNHGLIAIDSIRTYHINQDDKIEISIGKPLNVIH